MNLFILDGVTQSICHGWTLSSRSNVFGNKCWRMPYSRCPPFGTLIATSASSFRLDHAMRLNSSSCQGTLLRADGRSRTSMRARFAIIATFIRLPVCSGPVPNVMPSEALPEAFRGFGRAEGMNPQPISDYSPAAFPGQFRSHCLLSLFLSCAKNS